MLACGDVMYVIMLGRAERVDKVELCVTFVVVACGLRLVLRRNMNMNGRNDWWHVLLAAWVGSFVAVV